MRNKLVITTILILIAIGAISIILLIPKKALNKDIINTSVLETKEQKLNQNIDKYMAEQAENAKLSDGNYFCSHILYHTDDKSGYAYTWMYCASFSKTSEGSLKMGSAYSIPTRIEYSSSDYTILNYKQPGDGDMYGPTLKNLFPEDLYNKAIENPNNEEISQLDKAVYNKAITSIK